MQARRRNLQLLLTLAALPVLLAIPVSLAAHGAPANEFRGRYVIQHWTTSPAGMPTSSRCWNSPTATCSRTELRAAPRTGRAARRDRPRLGRAPGQHSPCRGREHRRDKRADGPHFAAGSTKRVAVVLFNFSNDSSQPYTPAFAEGVAFTNSSSVAAYYAASTWGNVSISGEVFGWYTIPSSNSGCSYSTWASQANTAASNAGVNLGAYDNVVYAFPSASGCGLGPASPTFRAETRG